MYISVSLFKNSFDDVWLTYKVPDSLNYLEPWMAVFVPFWEEMLLWVVLKKIKKLNFEWNIREVHSEAFSEVLLNPWQIALIHKLAFENFILIHHILSLFIPKNMRWKIEKNKFKLICKKIDYKLNNLKTLTKSQQEALKLIDNNKKVLLHWVTGSGKTELYVNLIKKNLEKWKQSLLLVPEIILTNQVLEYVRKVFWDNVIALNSSVTDAKKTDARIKIFSWEAKIIVWTRSSLFYPYNNLWVIIIDEEHDESYISKDNPRYDSVQIANFIADNTNANLILWSWTPKIEHMYHALKWDYKLVQMLEEIKSV